MVPVDSSDLTGSGHSAVVLVWMLSSRDDDPGKGSFLPHWYSRPKNPPVSGVAEVAPRSRSIIVPAPFRYSWSCGLSVIQICQLQRMVPPASLAAITALPLRNLSALLK